MKLLTYSHLLLFILLCISCSDNNNDNEDTNSAFISIDETEFTFENSGGSVKIELKTDGEWYAENIPDWVSLDYTNYNGPVEITVTVSSNEDTELRDAEIYFWRNEEKAILKIHQLNRKLEELTCPSLAFSSFDNISCVLGKEANERIFYFTTRALFINPFIKEKIFIGNLINSNIENYTDVSVYSGYTFNEITVFPTPWIEKSRTIIPSMSAQESFVSEILSKDINQSASFFLDGKGVNYNSHRELHLIGMGNMGINLDEIVSENSYQKEEMSKKNGIIYSFCQTLFTLNMDLQKDIVKEEINKEDFPENSISYISEVSYGRIGLLIIESDNDLSKVRVLVNKIMQNNSNDISQEEKTILEELNAFHLYYDKLQQLTVTKGKIDCIEAYKNQITDNTKNVFPFKFTISDYFEHGDTSMNFSITLN